MSFSLEATLPGSFYLCCFDSGLLIGGGLASSCLGSFYLSYLSPGQCCCFFSSGPLGGFGFPSGNFFGFRCTSIGFRLACSFGIYLPCLGIRGIRRLLSSFGGTPP